MRFPPFVSRKRDNQRHLNRGVIKPGMNKVHPVFSEVLPMIGGDYPTWWVLGAKDFLHFFKESTEVIVDVGHRPIVLSNNPLNISYILQPLFETTHVPKDNPVN